MTLTKMLAFSILFWLIEIHLPGQVWYLKEGTLTTSKAQATKFETYKQALDERFKHIGKGVETEIKYYE
jgi:hypothetical protein